MKRLRITFTKGEEIKHISHLDLLRAWERLLRRAGVPLAYSKGFNPHPKISVAAPLSVGIIGDAELMDITLEDDITPEQFTKMIEPQMPLGIRVTDVTEVPIDAPNLQSRLSFAEYVVDLPVDLDKASVKRRVSDFIAADHIERQRRTPHKVGSQAKQQAITQTYDLRRLVDNIWIEERSDEYPTAMRLHLRLRIGQSGAENGSGGVGRPDEVLDALGLSYDAGQIRRTKIVIES